MSPEEKEDLLKRLRFFQPNEYLMGWDDIKWEHRGVTLTSRGGVPQLFRYTKSRYLGRAMKIYEWSSDGSPKEVLDPDLIAVLKMAAFPTIIDTEE